MHVNILLLWRKNWIRNMNLFWLLEKFSLYAMGSTVLKVHTSLVTVLSVKCHPNL